MSAQLTTHYVQRVTMTRKLYEGFDVIEFTAFDAKGDTVSLQAYSNSRIELEVLGDIVCHESRAAIPVAEVAEVA